MENAVPNLSTTQFWVLMGGLLFILLVFVLLLINLLPKRQTPYPYEKQKALFTAAELAFYAVLSQTLSKQFLIFGKVRLADVIKPQNNLTNSDRQRAFNKISAKHVDFVICQPKNLMVIGIVELDDSSHLLPERRSRDQFVDAALAAAGIPILHIKVQRQYSTAHLRQQIAEKLNIH